MSRTDSSKQHPLEKAEYERISRFRYRLRRFLRISEKLCKDQGLTPLQYQLLLHVKGFPDRDWASIGELAERLQAKHNGVVALIDRCEKLDLVVRNPGRHDRRVVEVHLRPKGEDMLSRIAAQHQDELQLFMGTFAQADNASPP
ncbi:MAG: MarR family winged helix-turn-helix transcriptional regulator [Thiobacillus sp.]|nr:MarR family winged helix-turn-helix transcriptional regulator [Thiobacillus sp.]